MNLHIHNTNPIHIAIITIKNKTAIMKQEEEKLTGLPENAFRELKPGEVYNPLMSPDKNIRR